MSWVMLQVGCMLLTSVNSVLDKRMVRDYETNPIVYLASFAAVGLPAAALGVWLAPWPGFLVAGTGAFTGLLFSVVVLLYYQAVNQDEVSRLIPLLRLTVVARLALLAIFLNDQLSFTQYLATGVMLLGAFTLAWRPHKQQPHSKVRLNRGMILMILVAMIQAISGMLESHIILNYSPWTLMMWSNLGTVMGFTLLLTITKHRDELRRTWIASSFKFKLMLIGEQVGRLITGTMLGFAVFESGSAALVATLGGIRPLIVMILAGIFLDERFTRHDALPKIVGIVIMAIGTGLLAIV